ncbi:MAG: hypothetical protein F6K41_44355 [Symploca sp. SIO3E6]|nr:hypothetical protein [Caldora sp. SIO3E6]
MNHWYLKIAQKLNKFPLILKILIQQTSDLKAGVRRQEAGVRRQEAGVRRQEAGGKKVYSSVTPKMENSLSSHTPHTPHTPLPVSLATFLAAPRQ